VLLAEDNQVNQKVVVRILEKAGHHVVVAENGKEALDELKRQQFDLVLMDVQMPEMDGLTATRMLRQWEKERGLAPTPIIALTASALAEDVERSVAAGCNAHVSKPVRKRVLLEAIRSVVALSAAATKVTIAPASSNGAGTPPVARDNTAATPSK
jgi:CheY-like chemotaxis protein